MGISWGLGAANRWAETSQEHPLTANHQFCRQCESGWAQGNRSRRRSTAATSLDGCHQRFAGACDANFSRASKSGCECGGIIMRMKRGPEVAGVRARSDTAPGDKVKAEADEMIERAIRRIHACQNQLDRKALHGPYGRQQMVETIRAGLGNLDRTISGVSA